MSAESKIRQLEAEVQRLRDALERADARLQAGDKLRLVNELQVVVGTADLKEALARIAEWKDAYHDAQDD